MQVRVNADAGLAYPGLNCEPHCGEIYINDDTGVALAITATTAIAHATLTLAGPNFGLTIAPTAGSFTIARAGLYRVAFALSEITPVNSQVITLEVFKNGAAVAAAANVSPGARAVFTQPGTAVAVPTMSGTGYLRLARGDVLTLTVNVGSTTFTVKRLRFTCEQVQDLTAAVTA
jgi:hypothetical protein